MAKINTLAARKKLAVRREPHWSDPVAKGLFVGFRALDATGNGTWVARYRIDGGQRYKALDTTERMDFEGAQSEARAFKKMMDAGMVDEGIRTVADACRDYVTALEKEGREATAKDAARRFERAIYRDRIGKIALHRLRQTDIEAWRDRLEAGDLPALPVKKGRPPIAKPLTKQSANRMRTVLVAALNRAVARRHLVPERAIEWNNVKPHKSAGERRELYLDKKQRRALLEHAQGDVRDLIECIILTGCRPGDPAAVLRKDYDARHGMVTFRTKGHERTVPLAPQAKALFDRLAKAKTPAAPMFANGGKPWTAKEWDAQFRDAAKAAKLPSGAVLYTLRHCWITDAIRGGLDLLTVAKLAGTSLAMIEKHYGKLVQEAARDKLAAVQML